MNCLNAYDSPGSKRAEIRQGGGDRCSKPERGTLQRGGRLGLMLAALCLTAALPSMAHANDLLVIPDASVVKYVVTPDGFVYLRNLNEVDPTWAGCCTNFWMNTTTDGGRTQFAAFLSARVSRQRIVIYASSKTGSPNQALLHVGDF